MKVRAHLLIAGKVQGVFFRSATKEKAMEFGVHGWIRNLEDGRVEAIFEGEKSDVKKLVDWCYHGPTGAVVSVVDVEWGEEYTGQYNSFFVAG